MHEKQKRLILSALRECELLLRNDIERKRAAGYMAVAATLEERLAKVRAIIHMTERIEADVYPR